MQNMNKPQMSTINHNEDLKEKMKVYGVGNQAITIPVSKKPPLSTIQYDAENDRNKTQPLHHHNHDP